ncbi:unnamed protein product, partial [marine sediment metagenome]
GIVFICFVSIFLLLSKTEEKPQEKEKEKQESTPIIRIDLLQKGQKKLKPPRRNIFIPKRSSGEEFLYESQPGVQGQNLLTPDAGKEDPFQNETQNIILNLRYVGFVKSGKKIVALILLDGEALAVESGDMISEGVEIGKISSEEIEILSPGSKQRRYPLEGEKP